MSPSSKKTKRDDWRDDGLKKGRGVDYSAVSDRRQEDPRFEREKAKAGPLNSSSSSSTATGAAGPGGKMSSTFDAFHRMAAGLDARTLAEKISDPNRPTWEQYKKDNEDKLDLKGVDERKMAEYRAQLDRDREARLAEAQRKASGASSSRGGGGSESEDESDDRSEDSRRHKRRKHKHKKESSKRKSKKDKKKHKVCSLRFVCLWHLYIYMR
jgi:type IV secretory pathway VirB10-like protein